MATPRKTAAQKKADALAKKKAKDAAATDSGRSDKNSPSPAPTPTRSTGIGAVGGRINTTGNWFKGDSGYHELDDDAKENLSVSSFVLQGQSVDNAIDSTVDDVDFTENERKETVKILQKVIDGKSALAPYCRRCKVAWDTL